MERGDQQRSDQARQAGALRAKELPRQVVKGVMAPKMRRPAAMPARVGRVRRPAQAALEEETEERKPAKEEYHPLASLTLDRMKELDIVELGETSYYGAYAKIAGRIRSLKPSEEEVEFELSGTLTDRILERFGGSSSRTVKVHACAGGCGG